METYRKFQIHAIDTRDATSYTLFGVRHDKIDEMDTYYTIPEMSKDIVKYLKRDKQVDIRSDIYPANGVIDINQISGIVFKRRSLTEEEMSRLCIEIENVLAGK